VYVTKTTAAYEVALSKSIDQVHFDGTSRRQQEFNNLIPKVEDVFRPGQYRKITLDGCIVAVDGTAVNTAASFQNCFKEGGRLLNFLRAVFAELYPNNNLINDIPTAEDLTFIKLNNSFKTSDGCSTAVKLRREVEAEIKKIAREIGLSVNDIRERAADCWCHMMNVWFGGVSAELSNYISDFLAEDLKEIPPIYRVCIDAIDMMRCTEKLLAPTANYAKGSGAEFEQWMLEHHPGAILYPTARACGGARQDLCVEGAPAILMNLPYYLEFLNWRMAAVGGKSDAILATKMWIMLRSSEVIALLRVLSILHIAICLPIRWLAGKCHELKEYDFGYYDMSTVLTCMESSFHEILDEPSLFLDEEFMMDKLFGNIIDKVPPLREYLEHMFEERVSLDIHGKKSDSVLLDLLRALLFYPVRSYVAKTHDFCLELAVVAIQRFLTEMHDESKVTHHYLESINGKYSLAVISEEERQAGMGIEASNNISESVHASSTHSLKMYGTIRLDSAAAEGQTRTNNDFGRDYESLIHRGVNDPPIERDFGFFLRLHPKIQTAMIVAGKRMSKEMRRMHDDALKASKQAKMNKMKLMQQKNAEARGELWIEAMNYIEQYSSNVCWKDAETAVREYNLLESEAKRLKACKLNISIRKKGFGWEDAGHNWSKDGYTFTSKELLDHFINTVLPMELEERRPIPTEPQITLSVINNSLTLGTVADLEFDNAKSEEQFKQDMTNERARREAEGDTDRAGQLQSNVMPEFGDNLIGFHIEFCFNYSADDGSSYLAWIEGVIESIVNIKQRTVMIRWNEDKVAEGDLKVSKHTLSKRRWNPKNAQEHAWREYIGDLNE
jgi:uncharacterized membrane protein